MDPATLYRVLDQLIERFATGAEPAALQAARRQFETRRGRVFEDEDMWELASACFVECFVLEGPKDAAAPPAAAALRDPAFEQSAVLAWLRSQRSLYRVVSLSEAEVEVDDLIGGAGFRVAEPRSFQGVDRGDVMEARLVGYDGAVYFGRGFFFHPSGAHAAIARHVRTIVDSGGSRLDAADFCANLRVRCDRYGHVSPLKLYESAVVDPAAPGYGVAGDGASETPAS